MLAARIGRTFGVDPLTVLGGTLPDTLIRAACLMVVQADDQRQADAQAKG